MDFPLGGHDILSGTGRGSSNNHGNIVFRRIVDELAARHTNDPLHAVVFRIWSCLEHLDPPARFVAPNGGFLDSVQIYDKIKGRVLYA
jgi:hypothetical protein